MDLINRTHRKFPGQGFGRFHFLPPGTIALGVLSCLVRSLTAHLGKNTQGGPETIGAEARGPAGPTKAPGT